MRQSELERYARTLLGFAVALESAGGEITGKQLEAMCALDIIKIMAMNNIEFKYTGAYDEKAC